MPAVSICIPTYNHARFLKDAVASATAQRYADLEILIVDNASQDETPEIAAQLASKDARIKYLRHPENVGLIRNFDACLQIAQGRYIKYLCSDDVLEPECVARMAEVLDAQPEVAVVACARTMTDVDLNPLRVVTARAVACRVPSLEMISECFFLGNKIGEPTAVMFRRADAARGFRLSYQQLVDLEMWFHLMQSGDIYVLPGPLCRVRQHQNQATWGNDRDGKIVADRRLLYAEFADLVASYATLPRRLLWDVRMAYALARSEAAGCQVGSAVSEVYFGRTFRGFTRPMLRLATATRLRRWHPEDSQPA
jgi:glycosyltransferase involved in cell wall biosynthesis